MVKGQRLTWVHLIQARDVKIESVEFIRKGKNGRALVLTGRGAKYVAVKNLRVRR